MSRTRRAAGEDGAGARGRRPGRRGGGAGAARAAGGGGGGHLRGGGPGRRAGVAAPGRGRSASPPGRPPAALRAPLRRFPAAARVSRPLSLASRAPGSAGPQGSPARAVPRPGLCSLSGQEIQPRGRPRAGVLLPRSATLAGRGNHPLAFFLGNCASRHAARRTYGGCGFILLVS